MPRFYIAEDAGESVYEIFDDEVSLGRGAANGMQIHDSHASKMHAVVRKMQGHWKLVDLESKNGTRVNGTFRNQHWLRDGDTIAIGTSTLRYDAQGSPQGSPAAAAGVAVAARPAVPARPAAAPPPAPARPALQEEELTAPAPAMAAPAMAAPAPAVEAPTAEEAPAFSAPVSPSRSRRGVRGGGGSPRRRSGRDDDYDDDDYDDDDDAPRHRSKQGSGPMVILGIVGAIAFLVLMFALFSPGQSQNEMVLVKADRMADKRHYEKALAYAEQNADPSGEGYAKLRRTMRNWQDRLDAKKQGERNAAAQKYFRFEIYQKQAITGRRKGGFRAKDALPEREVVRLLREFLAKYPGSSDASLVLHSEQADYRHMRDAMREYASPDLKSTTVLQAAQAEVDIDVSARRYGKAVMDLTYLRDMNRLCMTTENYTQLRKAVELKVQEILDQAGSTFRSESKQFKDHLSAGRRGPARQLLADMKRQFRGIDELSRKVAELEQRL